MELTMDDDSLFACSMLVSEVLTSSNEGKVRQVHREQLAARSAQVDNSQGKCSFKQ